MCFPRQIVLLVPALLLTALLSGQTCYSPAVSHLGSDGSPPSSGLIDLAATTLEVDTFAELANVPGNGSGVYVKDAWLVVFRYTAVTLTGSLSFAPHPSGAPVMWIVAGDVLLMPGSILDLRGEDCAQVSPGPWSQPGPGGFAGGQQACPGFGQASGLGPGGGPNPGGPAAGKGAEEFTEPGLPLLIGGSGGRGTEGLPGAAGGGAICIAASGTITIDGAITARGGSSCNSNATQGGGGAVKLLATNIAGSGEVDAQGGGVASFVSRGRVHIGYCGANTFTGCTEPAASVDLFAAATAPTLFPVQPPMLRVTQIESLSSGQVYLLSDDPDAGLDTIEAPVAAGESLIHVEGVNIPAGLSVEVRVTARQGLNTGSPFPVTNWNGSSGTVQVTLPDGRFEIQAVAR
ncbi:MAG: hypothetical protein AAF581_07820 [Planctomycetota bacterium]